MEISKFKQILRAEFRKYVEEEFPVLKYFDTFVVDPNTREEMDGYTLNGSVIPHGTLCYDMRECYITEELTVPQLYETFEVTVANQYIVEVLIGKIINKHPEYKAEALTIQDKVRKKLEYDNWLSSNRKNIREIQMNNELIGW